MKFLLRQENIADTPQINKLNIAASGQKSEAKLVDALRENKQAIVPELPIVAEVGGNIVGHILFSKI